MDIKAQVCTSTFVKTHKPPAEMMASAHRTTSSSYSPLFTTFTSVPLLLKTHKSSQSSPFWKKDVKGGKKRFYPCKAHVLLKEFVLLGKEQGVLNYVSFPNFRMFFQM